MTNAIGQYLMSITAAAMLLSLVKSLLPKGSVRKVALFVGGLLVVLTVLSPVADVDYDALARSMGNVRVDMESIEAGSMADNYELMSDIIKQRCQTYVLDKANALGAELEVEIVLGGEHEYPYPVSVVLSGKATPEQRAELTEYITRNMGISAREQEWKLK